ncbi:hypothetical protein BS47DRAFT_1394096 [Hydnum rufescens UP504]|uniref:Uncharacterized protein n=1 Tax=Hydnum rufescens UP504 TaxID=1448309 RepID=A0A9P6AV67_9AGAM|nr:hypothetical protein BS47DRAFT_1394096 [Hydnum rufescens UP504]
MRPPSRTRVLRDRLRLTATQSISPFVLRELYIMNRGQNPGAHYPHRRRPRSHRPCSHLRRPKGCKFRFRSIHSARNTTVKQLTSMAPSGAVGCVLTSDCGNEPPFEGLIPSPRDSLSHQGLAQPNTSDGMLKDLAIHGPASEQSRDKDRSLLTITMNTGRRLQVVRRIPVTIRRDPWIRFNSPGFRTQENARQIGDGQNVDQLEWSG